MDLKNQGSHGGVKSRSRTLAGRAVVFTMVTVLGVSLGLFAPPTSEQARGGALSGWKFCVDAGHGGSEYGAVGPTGLAEKDINLKVAFTLKYLLEAEGAQVLMTRQDDSYVSITQRWTMANSWGASRFISIHHNAISDPAVNGTETLVSTKANQESLELANSVQAELVGEFGLPNRGIKRVDYVGVLNNTSMPSILTEASFLSNPQEEQRLRNDAYLSREAQAIMRAIHMPSSINFILPQENRISYEAVDVDLQILGDSISGVDLFLEGSLVGSKAYPPYSFRVDTSSLPDGTYRLQAVAWYQGGQKASITRDLIVTNQAKRWYFAEGTTRQGFQEWLTILNPNPEAVDFKVTYAFEGRDIMEKAYRVEAESRYSIEVSSEVGVDRDVSVLIDSPLPVMVERPMYFLYAGQWAGGHVSSGANQPSTSWYFAEGCTNQGFEEWLCMFNPGDQQAKVRVEYLSSGGLLKEEDIVVPPRRRSTVSVNEKVGPGKEVSLRLSSNQPLVAERPIYFNYKGRWVGGHVSTGTNQPSSNWYFAEGYTGSGFDEYLCLFNPSTQPNKVHITYQTSAGATIPKDVVVQPLSRRTVYVNDDAGRNLQVSMALAGESPLVAERPMYYDFEGWCKGGDVGIGVKKPSRHWYFAEGYTGAGFEDWLCLQNPGDQQVEAEIRFHLESQEVLWESLTLSPHSRTSVNANSMVPYEEGVAFSIHASGDIIVERPMYFRYKGSWVGGHVSTGYAPGMEH